MLFRETDSGDRVKYTENVEIRNHAARGAKMFIRIVSKRPQTSKLRVHIYKERGRQKTSLWANSHLSWRYVYLSKFRQQSWHFREWGEQREGREKCSNIIYTCREQKPTDISVHAGFTERSRKETSGWRRRVPKQWERGWSFDICVWWEIEYSEVVKKSKKAGSSATLIYNISGADDLKHGSSTIGLYEKETEIHGLILCIERHREIDRKPQCWHSWRQATVFQGGRDKIAMRR